MGTAMSYDTTMRWSLLSLKLTVTGAIHLPALGLSVFICKMWRFRLGKFSSNPKAGSKLKQKMDRFTLLSAAKIFPSLECGKQHVLEPGGVCLG